MNLRASLVRISGLALGADFFRFWLATSAALFGSSFGLIVIPLVASLALNASAGQVGLIGFLELLPFLVFGLFVGAWIDRVPRRRIMIWSHVLRACVLAFIPLAAAADVLTVGLLYVISFGFGSLTLLFEVAHQAYLPTLVAGNQLLDANGRMQFSRSSAELSGPGVAGVVVEILTAPFAVIVNALSFLGAAVLLVTVQGKETLAPKSTMLLTDVREGLAFVVGDRTLRALALSLSALYFFITAITPLIILFVSTELGLAPAMIGIAFAVGGAGTLLGAVINPWLTTRFGLNRVMPAAAFAAGIGPLCVAVAGRSTAFPLLLFGELLTAAAATVFAVAQVSLRQHVTPPQLQGRMNGTMRFMGNGGRALGILLAGLAATVIGLRYTIALAALGGVVAVVCLLASPVARLRDLDEATVVDGLEAQDPAASHPGT